MEVAIAGPQEYCAIRVAIKMEGAEHHKEKRCAQANAKDDPLPLQRSPEEQAAKSIARGHDSYPRDQRVDHEQTDGDGQTLYHPKRVEALLVQNAPQRACELIHVRGLNRIKQVVKCDHA